MPIRAALPALALLAACAANPGETTGSAGETTDASTSSATATTAASTTGDGTTGAVTTGAPEDGPRLHQLQALGTHNSYHVSPGTDVPEWDYTHRPLAEQLGEQGVRKFELDVNYDIEGAPYRVYHVVGVDTGSTCPTLPACLEALKGWSDAHPAHHPLYVMLELKSTFSSQTAAGQLQELDAQVLSVWPRERLIVPDDVQRDAPTLREGLAAGGWPTIDAARGKLLLVLHDGGPWRDAYVGKGQSTKGRVLFPDAFGALDLPYAAVHSLNDPVADAAAIAAAVDAGHLVRTRADADNVEPAAGDTARGEAALASGAHFISTDYPPPKGAQFDYVFTIPGGVPSRCNPRTAPPDCAPEQIEDPAAIGP